jgi:hypothetical protein
LEQITACSALALIAGTLMHSSEKPKKKKKKKIRKIRKKKKKKKNLQNTSSTENKNNNNNNNVIIVDHLPSRTPWLAQALPQPLPHQ